MDASAPDPAREGRRRADRTPAIRVVHLLHLFRTGGMEKGIAACIRAASPDIEHVLVCLAESGEMEAQLPPGIAIHSLNKPAGHSLRFILRLSRLLRTLRPCVVHTRNWSGMDGIVAARLAGIEAIVHGEHGWEMNDPEGTLGRRILLRRFLSRRVKGMTCVSRDLERWLRKSVGVRGPVSQIYNGVDPHVFAPGPGGERIRAELGIGPRTPLCGIVGRLDPIKDHALLFRAFARLRERNPEAQLLCVGDGPEAARLAQLAGPGVRLLGARFDVPEFLRALDLFVLSSRNEGISNTILEAMATGLPVLATRVGGNVELVREGETGMLVASGDEEAFALAMATYLEDPELRRAHGARGREVAREHFSVARMVRNYEQVWRACAEHLEP